MALRKKNFKQDAVARKNRLNAEITHPEVRLIADDGEQLGVVSIAEALRKAEQAKLDLVEMSPNAKPPVCRLMDYGKHLFEEKKKRNEAKKKQKQVQVKEIKFRPTTEDGDYKVKLKKLKEFLEDGDKAKVTMRFRGREIAHKDIGLALLNRVAADLHEISEVEFAPKAEGKQITMVLAPLKQGKTAKKLREDESVISVDEKAVAMNESEEETKSNDA